MTDVELYFDPACPFCWQTSRGAVRADGRGLVGGRRPTPGGIDGILVHQAAGADLPAVLRAAGLPPELADVADRTEHDELIRQETARALELAGDDVGTPIISFSPPDGPAFFGPVISELPSDDAAVVLFDAVATLARWPGFAELKRSLRTFPDVRIGRDLREDQLVG